MSEVLLTMVRGTRTEIENTPILDGQLLFETDQGLNNKIYADNGLQRIQIGGSPDSELLKEVVKNTTVNLVPYPYENKTETTINGITFTINDDLSITLNGTATENASFALTPKAVNGGLPCSGILSIGGSVNGSDSTFYISGDYIKNNTVVESWGKQTNSPLTIDVGDNDGITVVITIMKDYIANNLTFYPMLEKGSIAHSYVRPINSEEQLNKAVAKVKSDAGYWIAKGYTIPSTSTTYEIGSSLIDKNSIIDIYYSEESKDIVISAVPSYAQTNGILTINFQSETTDNIIISGVRVVNI